MTRNSQEGALYNVDNNEDDDYDDYDCNNTKRINSGADLAPDSDRFTNE